MAYEHKVQWCTNNKYWNLPDIKVSGLVLHSVGCPQPKASVFQKNFNSQNARASVHAFIEPGLVIETAPMMQTKRKAKKCYHVGAGPQGLSYNSSRIGIEMCEPSTIKYSGGASFTDKDPAKTAEYVRQVTDTAAQLFADLCIFHNLSVDLITTHHQAHLAGYGSNHGDPDHIWKVIDYDLAQFRKDVQKYINEKKGDVLANMTREEFESILDQKIGPTYRTMKQVPDFAKEAIQAAMDAGCLAGTGQMEAGLPVLNISYDFMRTLVVLYRAGIFNKAEKSDKE